MFKSTIAAIALMGLASAQSTTELFLVNFDQQSILASVVGSDSASATTYSLACGSAEECGLPSSFIFTQGPSTVHFDYTVSDESVGASETIEFACKLTSDSGDCSFTMQGGIGSMSSSSASSTSISNISELGGLVVTITAGAGATTGTAKATTTGTEDSSSGSASATPTGSANGSENSSSSSSTTSTSGNAAPMITNGPWIVGGAAAALAYAAM